MSTIDSVVPTIDSVIPTIDSVVPIDDIARTSVDINALYSSSVDMSANKSVKTSFDISVVTSGSKSVVTSGSKSVVTSGSKSVVTSGSKSVVTINGKTVRSNWGDSDYEDDDDDNDDKKKSITFLYSEVVTSKIPTMTTLENSKIVPVKPVKKLPMRFTTIRYYDITNYINMTNNKSRDVNTILTDMFAFNMSNSEIISIKEYSEGVKIIFTIPDSEFKKASFKDGNNGIKYKLRNIIFSDYNSSHVPSQYK